MLMLNATVEDFLSSPYYVPTSAAADPVPARTAREPTPAPELKSNEIRAYAAMPTEFTSMDTWITRTNLCCRRCGMCIPGFPWPIVSSVDVSSVPWKFRVHGLACLPTCIHGYIRETVDSIWSNCDTAMRYNNMVVQIIVGNRCVELVPGLPPSALQQYCGSDGMTLQYWREQNNKLWQAAVTL